MSTALDPACDHLFIRQIKRVLKVAQPGPHMRLSTGADCDPNSLDGQFASALASGTLTADQFLRPLDFIESEHDRQLVLYERLMELANDLNFESVMKEAESVLAFITEELPLHHKDEDIDLLRMLRQRCSPEDGIEAILEHLDWGHTMDKFLTHHLIMDLSVLVSGKALDHPTRVFTDLRTFAEALRRHLDWENKVVLPLARKRLKPQDLADMGRNMAARRGFSVTE